MKKHNPLYAFLLRQSFQPGLLGLFVNPYYFLRSALFKHIKDLAPLLEGKLLDFGCGRKPYENLFSVQKYIGLDMESTGHEHTNSKVDVYYDGKNIPFDQETFDSIFCSEVFEHVFNLDEVIPEIRRVLRTNGKIPITVPFCWHEHEVPWDFGRYTSFGIKHLLNKHGFEIVEYRKSGNFARVNFQLWALYFYDIIQTKSKKLNYLLRMMFVIPVNIIGMLICPLLPVNKSLYFNNVVVAKKI